MRHDPSSLAESVRRRVLVLDGAMGTELERRGVTTPAPLWSAAALIDPDHLSKVAEIHADYVAAGADILVANTFRTNARTLKTAGMQEVGLRVNCIAVELARGDSVRLRHQVRTDYPPNQPFVVASVAPVEDCYSPQLVPEEPILELEHAQMMSWLKVAEPDALWIETMNTVREARAAARTAHRAELPFAVSFVLRQDGRLLSDEPLEEAVEAVEPFGPLALGLNCIPPDGITAHLPRLRRLTRRPLAAYAHVNNATPTPGWNFAQEALPAQYARDVTRWLDTGASIVGGCCGTTPEHIRAVRNAIDRWRAR